MIQTLYDFPLPNNGDRYDLSQEELNDLLYKAYQNGYKWGKEIATSAIVTTSASIEDKDDSTNWKETWIKCINKLKRILRKIDKAE